MARDFGKGTKILWHDRKRWCGLPLSFTRYYIVEKPNSWLKLFVDKGFLYSHVEEVNMFRIEDVTIVETFTNKFWGTGTLTIYANDASSNATETQIFLKRIKNPRKVRNLITDLLEQDRKARNVNVGEMHL